MCQGPIESYAARDTTPHGIPRRTGAHYLCPLGRFRTLYVVRHPACSGARLTLSAVHGPVVRACTQGRAYANECTCARRRDVSFLIGGMAGPRRRAAHEAASCDAQALLRPPAAQLSYCKYHIARDPIPSQPRRWGLYEPQRHRRQVDLRREVPRRELRTDAHRRRYS